MFRVAYIFALDFLSFIIIFGYPKRYKKNVIYLSLLPHLLPGELQAVRGGWVVR
jgi:hypothetical protein